MHNGKLSAGLISLLAIFIVTPLLISQPAAAQQETVLYNFGRPVGSAYYPGSVVFDTAGNFYGTSSRGGTHGNGAVFELVPAADGSWTEKVLFSFSSPAMPGFGPLTIDAAGNVYGTTYRGGAHGGGTVFELTPAAGGQWTYKVLYNFSAWHGPGFVGSSVTLDSAGNLYGTTFEGGAFNLGTAFELSPASGGNWTLKILHSFSSNDGCDPSSPLAFDAVGKLYGTCYGGGPYGGGTVFQLTPTTAGAWTEKIIASFSTSDLTGGIYPVGDLLFDAAGNLYGTNTQSGDHNGGAVFELSPTAGGLWTLTQLFSFGNGQDGMDPMSGVIFDVAGNLYGTTSAGGAFNRGTVFELSPQSGGGWSEKIVHNFTLKGFDGEFPEAGVVFDATGNLYSSTPYGGSGAGTFFMITP